MNLRFFSQNDSGKVIDELFNISLGTKEFHDFLLKTNGGSISIRKPLMMGQGFFPIEGADWTGNSEIIIKPEEKENDFNFIINQKYLSVLIGYAKIAGRGEDSIKGVGKFIEDGIKILVSA